VIANSFLESGQKYLLAAEGTNIADFRQGIRDSVKLVLSELDKMAIPVENAE